MLAVGHMSLLRCVITACALAPCSVFVGACHARRSLHSCMPSHNQDAQHAFLLGMAHVHFAIDTSWLQVAGSRPPHTPAYHTSGIFAATVHGYHPKASARVSPAHSA